MPPKPKKIRVKETEEVFANARECAVAIGGDYGSIYSVLRGNRLTHKGYSFEYVEPVEGDED